MANSEEGGHVGMAFFVGGNRRIEDEIKLINLVTKLCRKLLQEWCLIREISIGLPAVPSDGACCRSNCGSIVVSR